MHGIFIQKHTDPPDTGGRRQAKRSLRAIPFDTLRGGGGGVMETKMKICGGGTQKIEICGERGSATKLK